MNLEFLGEARCANRSVTALEFVNASGGINKLLLTCEERMARGANTKLDVLTCGTSFVCRSAGADDNCLLVVGMNFWLHFLKGCVD